MVEGKEKMCAIVSIRDSTKILARARVWDELGQIGLAQVQRGTKLVFCRVGRFLKLKGQVPYFRDTHAKRSI